MTENAQDANRRRKDAERMARWRNANPDKAAAAAAKSNLINAEYRREYYQKNKERYAERQKAWKQANPNRSKEYSRKSLLKKYGLTEECYSKLLAAQGNCCATCGSPEPKTKTEKFFIDHCHKTGAVRELLCHRCNTALGMVRDSPELLVQLASYLLKHAEKDVTPTIEMEDRL